MPDELLPSDAAVHRISVRCPAKVNLGLEVLARRADGYHEICTVLQAIDLYDELTVETAAGAGAADGNIEVEAPSLSVEGPFAAEVPAEGNTVLTAWAVGGGVRLPQLTVRLLKRIPSGAGLGGGSSNAAAMLLALREVARLSAGGRVGGTDVGGTDAPVRLLVDIHVGTDTPPARASGSQAVTHSPQGMTDGGVRPTLNPLLDLPTAALRIGSDVPFFLQGGCALATGRGEELTPLARKLPLHIALLVPHFDSPTGAAYAALGRGTGTMTPLVVPQLARALEHGDWSAARPGLVNDFAGYLLARHPQAREWIAALERYGALAATFTGSGSGLIGVFDAQAPCAAAVEALAASDEFRYCGAHRAIG